MGQDTGNGKLLKQLYEQGRIEVVLLDVGLSRRVQIQFTKSVGF